MRTRSHSIEALVLKRTNTGEADRVVTIISPTLGKITSIAKGARKMSSSKRAYLEPGNHIKVQLIPTSSIPILSQALLVSDTQTIRNSLAKVRQLTQFLEILDTLFIEEEIETDVFDEILAIRQLIIQRHTPGIAIKKRLENLVASLGYQHLDNTTYNTLLDYVSVLADKPMRSWEYLAVKNE